MNEELKILIAAILDKAKSESNINAQLKQLKLDTLKLNVDINGSTATIKSEVQRTISQVNQQVTSGISKVEIPLSFDKDNMQNLKRELQQFANEIAKLQGYKEAKVTTNYKSSYDELGNLSDRKLSTASIDYYNESNEKALTTTYKLISGTDELGNEFEKLVQSSEKASDNIKKQVNEQQKLVESMAKVREQANAKHSKETKDHEVTQAKAVNKALEEEYNERVKLANIIGANREKSEIASKKRVESDNLAQAKAVNKDLEDEYAERQKLLEAMATAREKSEVNRSKQDRDNEVAQAKAVNKALEEEYSNKVKQIEIDAKVARGKVELAKQMDIMNAKANHAGIALNPENQAQFQSNIDSASTIQDLQEVSHYLKMARFEYQELNATMTKDLPNNALDNANKKLANMSPTIDTLQSKFQMLGKKMPEDISKTFDGLRQQLDAINNIKDPKEKVKSINEMSASVQRLGVDLRKLSQEQKSDKFDVNLGFDKVKLNDRITAWLNENQKAAKMFGAELKNIQSQIDRADKAELGTLTKQFQGVQTQAKALGVTGRTVFGELKNNISKFGSWFLIGGGVSSAVRSITSAITELKGIDTQLTEISKTSELTTQQLKALGNASFDAANKYGATVQGYLEGVKEFSRAGKENAQALAEVSILAQSAGDMTSETANKYLLATDAAYKLGGSEEKLTAVLDAQNQITNRNAVNMEQLAQATMVAGSQASQSGVAVDEMTAAVSTMAIVTQQGGDIAGRAFKGILMNLQQVSGELDGEIIDETSFKKVEKTLDSVGVSMSTVVDGAVKMREPMEILKELSQVYNSLDDLDPRKAAIISDLGGKYRGNQLSGLLGNWEIYEKVLSDYTNSTGSALEEAQKTADSWEGRLNKLTNTWNGFVGNFASSDFFKGAITGGESFIKILDGLVSTLGGIPTLAATAAAALSFKNIGISKVKYAPPYPMGTAA